MKIRNNANFILGQVSADPNFIGGYSDSILDIQSLLQLLRLLPMLSHGLFIFLSCISNYRDDFCVDNSNFVFSSWIRIYKIKSGVLISF